LEVDELDFRDLLVRPDGNETKDGVGGVGNEAFTAGEAGLEIGLLKTAGEAGREVLARAGEMVAGGNKLEGEAALLWVLVRSSGDL
jgi:hypothetical protein